MRTGEDDLRLAPNIGIKQGAQRAQRSSASSLTASWSTGRSFDGLDVDSICSTRVTVFSLSQTLLVFVGALKSLIAAWVELV